MVGFKNLVVVAVVAGQALAAPVLVARQGAGVGQIGKQAGEAIANDLGGNFGSAGLRRRQGAGVGAGCDSLFSDLDTATGQIGKQAGEAVANDLGGKFGSAGLRVRKRQLNNIGVGLGDVVEALPGGESTGEQIIDQTGTIDGDGTNGAAQLGEALGNGYLELGNTITKTAFGTTANDEGGNGGGSGSGGPPPPPPPHKRQLNNIGVGLGDVVEALPGGKQAGEQVIDSTGTIDGDGTNGAADLGEALGNGYLALGNAITETAFGTTANDEHGSGGSSGGPPPPPPHRE